MEGREKEGGKIRERGVIIRISTIPNSNVFFLFGIFQLNAARVIVVSYLECRLTDRDENQITVAILLLRCHFKMFNISINHPSLTHLFTHSLTH